MKNSILLGDCNLVLPTVPSESVDLTVFSPPYDLIRDYGNNWSFDYKTLGKEIFRVTKDGGMAACVIQDGTKDFAKSTTSFRMCLDWVDNAGFKLFETCIYSRDGRPGGWWNKRFRVDHEYIFLFLKGERPKFFDKTELQIASKNAGKVFRMNARKTDGSVEKQNVDGTYITKDTKCRGTVWNYKTSNTEGNKIKAEHPATYPDKLASDIIKCFSKPGDLILDPMCGSGTTCVIAQNLKRDYLGIEINPDYHPIIEKRLELENVNNQKTSLEEFSVIRELLE